MKSLILLAIAATCAADLSGIISLPREAAVMIFLLALAMFFVSRKGRRVRSEK